MAVEHVFVDTWALLALTNRRDMHHALAKRVGAELAQQRRALVTSDFVLTEFPGFAARQPYRSTAISAVDKLKNSSEVEIVPATRELWNNGFELFCARPDKSWSLVDCTSIWICQQRVVSQVFTHDNHFAQAGLTPLVP